MIPTLRTLPRLAALALLLATPALAQQGGYPARPVETHLSDLADLLPPEAEARLDATLRDLRAETDIEVLIVTIETRDTYAPAPSMEAFVTDLFNDWGIGDATRNDGILLYVARSDREMRIELGEGYDSGWNPVAQEVINSNVLPYFRDDQYADGIEAGTRALIRDIVRPFAAQAAPPAPSWGDRLSELFPFLAIGGVLLIGLRRRIGDWSVRLRPCPNCGQRGLHRHRDILSKATTAAKGRGLRITTCDRCDYRDETPFDIGRISTSSSSGGGRSSGGGASGRW
ncbi:TPM domain-containing protein [Actibacterium sp. XHP0104]|uniref:TPM domain-containing protein n=1 Tax=Actibacterium sp. XHP0104 TaxID=2984335 RepID=UPI0021E8967E|nr:TPM domain-containing protein [Actibacterium sp. XHP0104]MCV2881193.1 TPM domain-containing protein [Actibacterium sp. XHP0104]